MFIHGASIAADGRRYVIMFRPLTYRDWLYHLNAEALYSPAAIRYLFTTYVTEAYVETETGREQLSVETLITTLKPAHAQKIVDQFVVKSGYNDNDAFDALISESTDSFRTHQGLYDLFLFLNTDIDDYIALLSADAQTRAHVIAGLQFKKGLTVKERVNDCEQNKELGIALDLIHSDAEYTELLKQQGYSRKGDVPQKRLPADAEAALAASMPDGISQAARALQAKINRDRSAPKKAFDWRADEHSYADPDGI